MASLVISRPLPHDPPPCLCDLPRVMPRSRCKCPPPRSSRPPPRLRGLPPPLFPAGVSRPSCPVPGALGRAWLCGQTVSERVTAGWLRRWDAGKVTGMEVRTVSSGAESVPPDLTPGVVQPGPRGPPPPAAPRPSPHVLHGHPPHPRAGHVPHANSPSSSGGSVPRVRGPGGPRLRN